MKRFQVKITMALLFLLTVAVLGWTVLVILFAENYIGMMTVCAPSPEGYGRGVQAAMAVGKEVCVWTIAPLVLLNVLWMMAFALKRRSP
jgi:hypothetical protein